MSNLYAVHMDPATWPEPEVFNPSRHLTEEGKIIKKDEFIAFSIGELDLAYSFEYMNEDTFNTVTQQSLQSCCENFNSYRSRSSQKRHQLPRTLG